MLFSSSPVKKISEKIKPISESGKRKVSRLKFDRKSDYKTFLDFIKKNTKDLEEQQVKKEKTSNKGAFGLIGLGILGGAFGGKKKDDNAIKTSFISKAIQRAKLDAENEAKKKGKAGSGVGASAAQFFKKVTQLDKPFIPKRDPQTYRQKGANKKEYIFNRERRNKLAKSKQSVVSEETVSNKNRVKKTFSKTKVAAEVGGQGFGGASGNRRMINVSKTFPEDSSVGNRPQSSLGKGEIPDDIKKAIKLTQDYEAGKITKQQYENKMNEIKNFKPTDKTPKTLNQIAKDLNKGEKTLRFNKGKGYQTNLFDPSVSFGNITGSGDSVVTSGVNPFRFNPTEPFMDDDVGNPFRPQDRKFKQGSLFDKPKTKKIIDKNKLFQAPEIPSNKTTKLNTFDKVTNFSNRVMNSPAFKFTTFLGGLFTSPKVEIIKQLFTATPLADGTLEGKPGVGINPENFIFNEDAAVNIFNFSEGRESMIPLSSDVKLPSVSTPTNLIEPENNIFIDFEFDATEDLFFMKMAGS